MTDLPDDEPDKLVALWCARARRSEAAHYQTAAQYSLYHAILTAAAVVLSSVTASGLFASRGSSGPYRVTFGILGILAAVVTGIDRGQRFAERSEQHRISGAAWAVIVNATEELSLRSRGRRIGERDFDELRKRMDDTTAHSPQLPQTIFVRNGLGDTYLCAFQPLVLRRDWRWLWLKQRPIIATGNEQSAEPVGEPPPSDRTRSPRRSAGRKTRPGG